MIHTYPPIKTRREHRGKCPNCGKTVTRSKQFWMTVNPFNRNPDGSVRTAEEIRADVNAEADAWVPDFTHCEPKEQNHE